MYMKKKNQTAYGIVLCVFLLSSLGLSLQMTLKAEANQIVTQTRQLQTGCTKFKNCKTCSDVVCTQCNENYFFDDGSQQCKQCLSRCSVCVNALQCKDCNTKYGLSDTKKQCKKCSDLNPNCLLCEDNVCNNCIEGFYVDSGNCKQCNIIPSCLGCYDSSACYNCIKGYFVDKDSKCSPCNLNNCQICEFSESVKCTQCVPDYYYDEGSSSCVSCTTNPNCKSCTDKNMCHLCEDNYLLNLKTNSCEECGSFNCLNCKQGLCLSCIEGYTLNPKTNVCIVNLSSNENIKMLTGLLIGSVVLVLGISIILCICLKKRKPTLEISVDNLDSEKHISNGFEASEKGSIKN